MPLNETRIQLPLAGLRNYMPDNNIVIAAKRIVPLMRQAVQFAAKNKRRVGAAASTPPPGDFASIPAALLTDRPNYSVTADICRRMLALNPNMTRSFNSARCLFGMSWLCEFWANTHYKWRFFHGKWSWRCGGKGSSVELAGLTDPREQRPLGEFLYFTKARLLAAYNDTDFGSGLRERPDGSETRIFQ